jgi:hypothetical protein
MSFNEGSEISFMPGSHGRLRSVDGAGAHVAIESGAASFQITPRADSKWLVDVGPFLVRVQGTVFAVSWDVTRERFELSLERGRVAVSGPTSSGDIVLRAGQRLVVNLPTAETLITEFEAGDGIAENPFDAGLDAGLGATSELAPESPMDASPRSIERSVASRSAKANKREPARWTDAVAAADWDRILREAEAIGIQQTLTQASALELMALADAARYRRRMTLARNALLSLRTRFPSSPHSRQAAYLLGRVHESSASGMSEALRWYDQYLSDAPSGAYASEALGRKMVLSGKLGRSAQTRQLAQEYLRRFPNGTYAGSARALLQSD